MFSERLKSLRKKDYTQQELADYLGISRQAYGKYENNQAEPDIKTLNKLAKFFNVSIDYLLGRTDIQNHVGIDNEDNDKNVALTFNGEKLSEDEQNHLTNELKRYRELKARLLKEKDLKN